MHDEFVGTMPVQDKHRFDAASLERFMQRNVAGYRGPLAGRAVQGRAVQPHVPAEDPGAALRAPAQAAGQAAAFRPCGGPRVPGDHCAAQRRHAGGAHLRPVRGRRGHRHGLLHHGVRGRPGALGPGAARHAAAAAARDLRGDEPRHRGPAPGRLSGASGSPTSASRATTSSARSAAGPSSTVPRKPRRSRRWTSSSSGCRSTSRPATRPAWCTATTAWTT